MGGYRQRVVCSDLFNTHILILNPNVFSEQQNKIICSNIFGGGCKLTSHFKGSETFKRGKKCWIKLELKSIDAGVDAEQDVCRFNCQKKKNTKSKPP